MRQIVIEAETPDHSQTIFRLPIDETLIGEGLTTAQIAVGEVPEQITALAPNFSGSVDDI